MVSVGNEDRKHVYAYTQRRLDLLRVGVRKLGSRRRQQSCGILVLSREVVSRESERVNERVRGERDVTTTVSCVEDAVGSD